MPKPFPKPFPKPMPIPSAPSRMTKIIFINAARTLDASERNEMAYVAPQQFAHLYPRDKILYYIWEPAADTSAFQNLLRSKIPHVDIVVLNRTTIANLVRAVCPTIKNFMMQRRREIAELEHLKAHPTAADSERVKQLKAKYPRHTYAFDTYEIDEADFPNQFAQIIEGVFTVSYNIDATNLVKEFILPLILAAQASNKQQAHYFDLSVLINPSEPCIQEDIRRGQIKTWAFSKIPFIAVKMEDAHIFDVFAMFVGGNDDFSFHASRNLYLQILLYNLALFFSFFPPVQLELDEFYAATRSIRTLQPDRTKEYLNTHKDVVRYLTSLEAAITKNRSDFLPLFFIASLNRAGIIADYLKMLSPEDEELPLRLACFEYKYYKRALKDVRVAHEIIIRNAAHVPHFQERMMSGHYWYLDSLGVLKSLRGDWKDHRRARPLFTATERHLLDELGTIYDWFDFFGIEHPA